MQQPCQQCGYESPANARFCRQCGATLFLETELSGAATRNYGKQEPGPSVAVAGSGQLPPSVADAIAGETERYYRAPPVSPPLVLNTVPIKSKLGRWRWFVLFLVLFIGAAIGAAAVRNLFRAPNYTAAPFDRERRQAEDEERRRQRELQRELEQQRRERENQIRDLKRRERDILNQQREAVKNAIQASEQARRAGTTLQPTSEKLLDFSSYEYPNATMRRSIRIPGYEALTQNTSDSFEIVSQFYQKKLGKPIIFINELREKRLVFQSTSMPAVLISIEPDEENLDQLKIVVLRSPFRNLKPDEDQNLN
jgi:hypothetical protein